MKKVFIIAAFAGLMACNNEPEVRIMGTQSDFTQDQVDSHPTDSTGRFDFSQEEGVSDSLVYGEWEPIDSTDMFGPFLPGEMDVIDSLETVSELLDHLETLPSE